MGGGALEWFVPPPAPPKNGALAATAVDTARIGLVVTWNVLICQLCSRQKHNVYLYTHRQSLAPADLLTQQVLAAILTAVDERKGMLCTVCPGT